MLIRLRKFVLILACVVAVALISNDAHAAGGVFKDLAGKTGAFADGLRKLAYVISGFGIIMFTFLAICGKINFKHLGYICISLFFLSGIGALIGYVTDQDSSRLAYKFQDTYIQAGRSVGELSRRSSF